MRDAEAELSLMRKIQMKNQDFYLDTVAECRKIYQEIDKLIYNTFKSDIYGSLFDSQMNEKSH